MEYVSGNIFLREMAFGPAFVIWVDRIAAGRFADTNKLFVAPFVFDVRITATLDNVFPTYHAEQLAQRLRIST